MASNAAVELIISLKDNASAGMNKIAGETGKMGAAAEGAKGHMGGLGGALGGLVSPIGLVTAGAGILVGGLIAATKAAMDEEVGIARMNQALQNNIPAWNGNTAAVEKQIEVNQKLAFSDDQLRDSLSILVTRTHDVGKAFEMQAIAMDLARGKNIDLATASNIVGKVMDGNVGILARYGVAVEKGASATEALGAIQKTFGGQAEAYANSAAGGVDKLKNAFDNVMETIGSALLPIIADLATKFSEMLPKIMDVVGGVMDFLKPAFELIGGLLNAIGTAVDWLGQKLGLWSETSKTATTNASAGWHEHETAVAAAATNIAASGTLAGQGYGQNTVAGVNAHAGALQDAVGGYMDTMDVQEPAGDLGFQVGAVYAAGTPGGITAGMAANERLVAAGSFNLVMAADQSQAAGALGGAMGQTLASNFAAAVSQGVNTAIQGANVAINSMLSALRAAGFAGGNVNFKWPGSGGLVNPNANTGGTGTASPGGYFSQIGGILSTGGGATGAAQEAYYSQYLKGLEDARNKVAKISRGGGGGGGGGGGKGGGGGATTVAPDPLAEASKIADMVKGAVDALKGLDGFKPIADEALNNFFAALDGVITRMNERMSLWWGHWSPVQAAIAKGAADAVTGILGAVGPLKSLADGFRPIATEAMDNFFAALDYMLDKMRSRMELWWGRWGEEQAKVAKGAGDAVVGILGALAPLQQLANGFRPVSTQIMDDFFAALDFMLDRLRGRMELWWGRWGAEQAAIAKGAGDAVTGVLGALAPLQKLAEGFKPISTGAMDTFFAALDAMIERLRGRIEVWWGRWGTEQANIAKGAGDAVAGVLSALEPLMKLNEFVRPSQKSIDTFFAALSDFLAAFDRKAAEFMEKAGVVASELAARIGIIMGAIGQAIDPLIKLQDFKPIDPAVIESFMSSVWVALNQMKVVVEGFPAGFLDAAAGWGAKLSTAFGGIKAALDILATLGGGGTEGADVGGPLNAVLTALQALMGYVDATALGVIDALKDRAGALGGAFDTLASTIHDDVAAILADLAKLPGGAGGGGGGLDLTIPHFARGGVVTHPTLAVVGERGPEAIVPLGAAGGRMGGLTINGNIVINATPGTDGGRVATRFLDELESQLGLKVRTRRPGLVVA